MDKEKGAAGILIILLIILLPSIYLLKTRNANNHTRLISTNPPTPTPYQFPYRLPAIPKNQSYRIIIVGDSIVGSLGPNANTLRLDLIKYYPDSEFVTYNYGYPSTSVLSLYPRLTQTTKNGPTENMAILKQVFELIIIESFGYNPLSEYTLAEGLQKQNEELERSVREILKQRPNAALAFLTPIAFDPENFARSTRDLSPTVRKQWVEERIAYINNHKKFAQEKSIPVIDVYNASLKENGEVDPKFISDDFVHPSQAGIELISKTIADYIYRNEVFPK